MLTSGFMYLLLSVSDINNRVLWYFGIIKKENWKVGIRMLGRERTIEIKASCFTGETETKTVE